MAWHSLLVVTLLNTRETLSSRVAQRSKALHRSTSGVSTDAGYIAVCVAAGCERETHEAAHNWPSVVRVSPEGMSLSHRALATPVAGLAHARCPGRQVYCVSSDTLVRLASGLSEQCVKEQSSLAGSCFGGCTALDLRHLSRCSNGTRLELPIGYHEKGVKIQHFQLALLPISHFG